MKIIAITAFVTHTVSKLDVRSALPRKKLHRLEVLIP